MSRKYTVRYEGEAIATFDTVGDAKVAIDLYEEIDKSAGIYEENAYEIAVKVRGEYIPY